MALLEQLFRLRNPARSGPRARTLGELGAALASRPAESAPPAAETAPISQPAAGPCLTDPTLPSLALQPQVDAPLEVKLQPAVLGTPPPPAPPPPALAAVFRPPPVRPAAVVVPPAVVPPPPGATVRTIEVEISSAAPMDWAALEQHLKAFPGVLRCRLTPQVRPPLFAPKPPDAHG